MRVLVGCEMSGIVRDAFIARGHDAVSCDFLPSERPGPHIQGNVLSADVLKEHWDLGIFHPDCTFLTVSGNRWAGKEWRVEARCAAMHFVRALWMLPIEKIAIENPIGVLSTFWRPPDQTVQPWQFGHGETKATCFWLKGLPELQPTNLVEGREGKVWREPPSPERKKNRSRTYQGIADAMAEQWGGFVTKPQQESDDAVRDIVHEFTEWIALDASQKFMHEAQEWPIDWLLGMFVKWYDSRNQILKAQLSADSPDFRDTTSK